MANFDEAFKLLMHFEDASSKGIVSNHDHDRGGLTIFGVSKKSWPNTFTDIRDALKLYGPTVALETAKSFYRCHFWLPIRGDQIKDQRTAMALFDWAVHSGVSQAVAKAQVTMNFWGAGLHIDGKCGQKTLSAINGGFLSLADYKSIRVDFLEDIVSRDVSQAGFFKGWMNRVDKLFDPATYGKGV